MSSCSPTSTVFPLTHNCCFSAPVFELYPDSEVVPVPGGQLPQDQVQAPREVSGAAPVRGAHSFPAHDVRGRPAARLAATMSGQLGLCCVRWLRGVGGAGSAIFCCRRNVTRGRRRGMIVLEGAAATFCTRGCYFRASMQLSFHPTESRECDPRST